MRNDFSSNYLAHHGILGQKWGHKNGPPYPLGASDHSASEKKAGWRESLAEKKKKRQGIKYKKEMQRLQTNIEYHKRERIRPLYVAESEVGARGLHKDIDKYRKAAKVASGIEDMHLLNAEMEYDKTLNGLIKAYGSDEFMKLSNRSIERGQKKIDRLFDETKTMTESYERHKKWNDEKIESSDKKAISEKSILPNKKEIASSMAKEMTSDIKRWVKEGDSSMPKSFKNMSDREIENTIAKKIEKNVANLNSDYLFKFSDGTVGFSIDGISEYSDSQPLYVEYDLKNKKVKSFDYA